MRLRQGFACVCLLVVFLLTSCAGQQTQFPTTQTSQPESPPIPTKSAPAVVATSTTAQEDTLEPTAKDMLNPRPTDSQPPPTRTPTSPPAPSPTVSPTPGVGSTFVSPLTGVRLVFVPEGDFRMGSDDADTQAYADERPQHTVFLDSFWIDQVEVSNEMFAAFLNDQSNQEDGGTRWLESDAEYVQIDQSGYDFKPKPGFEDHPVVGVSWFGAQAYCDWAGGRLPTEAEWEKAARGTDANIYPWGNDQPAGNLLNAADVSLASDQSSFEINDGFANTAPVGSFPEGASPYGGFDMAGNVWEWVSDWYGSEAYRQSPDRNPIGVKEGVLKVVRGGSWFDHPDYARSAYRAGFKPATHWPYVGFRCVLDEQIHPSPTSTPLVKPQASFARMLFRDENPSYEVVDIREMPDGGYVMVGNVSSTDEYAGAPIDLYAARFAPDGMLIWQRAFGAEDGSLSDGGTSILPVGDGSILVAGFFGGSIVKGKYAGRPWLLALDMDGAVLWEKQLPEARLTLWMDLVETKRGEYVVAGRDWGKDEPGIWLWHLDGSGELMDFRNLTLNLGGSETSWSPYFDLVRTFDQGFVLAGSVKIGPFASAQAVALRFNREGEIIWQQAYDQPVDGRQPISLVHLRSGGFIFAFTNAGGDHRGPILSKLDEDGQPQWWVSFPFQLISISRVVASDGGFAVSGWGVDGAWIGWADESGLFTSQLNFDPYPDAVNQFTGLDSTYDGGLIVAGTSGSHGNDLAIMRLDASFSSSFCRSLTSGKVAAALIKESFLSKDKLVVSDTLHSGEAQPIVNASWVPGDSFREACR